MTSEKQFNEWAKEIHENAVAHGWWNKPISFGDIIALCYSELSEALEEYRAGRPLLWYACKDALADYGICNPADEWDCTVCFKKSDCKEPCKYRDAKPEGVALEMIDCIIRILDWCAKESVDVDEMICLKHEYNKSRPKDGDSVMCRVLQYRHGGKRL